MSPKAGWSTPLLHVADVGRSIRFYRQLGFELVDVEGEAGGPAGWARLHTADGSAIMLLRGEAEHPVQPELQGIMLVLYTPELPALHAALVSAGEKPTPVAHPAWMPSGTFMLRDPDGYGVGVNHWGDAEHDAWLKLLQEKRAAGVIPQEA
ncbi:MAG TPA: VOC family protein [Candidatus Eisenbacteria bacterium]|nr:VOC family protein [Candidatus Eisenbacteria bacterium]